MFYWIFDLDDTLYQLNKPHRVRDGLYVNYSFLKEDKKLKVLLKFLTGKKIVLTNSISQHCNTILNKLKIENSFDQIFTRDTINSLKPHPNAYIKVIRENNINKQDHTFFFDDSPVNLIMAKKFGWITVLITPQPWKYYEGHPSIDFIFLNVHNAIAFLIKKIYKIK